MLLWLLRGAYVALLVGLAIGVATVFFEHDEGLKGILVPLFIVVFGGIVLITDVREKQKQITTISAIYFGLLLGLLIGWLFSMAVDPLLKSAFPNRPQVVELAKVLIAVISCYVTISTLLQTKDEFRFIIPYVEFS